MEFGPGPSRSSAHGIENLGYVEEETFLPQESRFQTDEPSRVERTEEDEPVGRRSPFDDFAKEFETKDHLIQLEDLYKKYHTDPSTGLREGDVRLNRLQYGENIIHRTKNASLWTKFLKTLIGGFQILLWIGASLCIVVHLTKISYLDNAPRDFLYLGVALVGVIIVSGLLTFFQEYSSDRMLASFRNMVPQYTTVLRKGERIHLDNSRLVVGDIIKIKAGEKIPADLRVIESCGLKVDNSSLTGESEPVCKNSECTSEDPMETKNLAFFSTLVVEGTATCLVVSVGSNTLMGKIATLSAGTDTSETPLAREITYCVHILSARAIFIGIIFFIISIFMGYSWIDASCFLVGIIVANVPEGLLATVTMCLALTAKRMASRNCLVKHLQAVETLGSTSTICSDKTGTLTQNQMTVSHLWCNNELIDCETSEISEDQNSFTGFQMRNRDAELKTLTSIAVLSSRSENAASTTNRFADGDAFDLAIRKYIQQQIGDVEQFHINHSKIFEIPFNSTNKYHISIHKVTDWTSPYYRLTMKGAPEELLEHCRTILIGDFECELDESWKEIVTKTYTELGNLGERVLGFCDHRFEPTEFEELQLADSDNLHLFWKGFRFVGLISLIDPPRSAVPDAIAKCRSAGIKVVMVTGDHSSTAKAIARAVGIISEGNETEDEMAERLNILVSDVDQSRINVAVLNGSQLKEMTSEELDDTLRKHEEIVFARTTPQQKLTIVEAFQRFGKIVAVTGDGVNDAPALKKADIGIAMGITGSDVSKEAADMIILDDNFASIVTSIEEGRLIFDNLKKCSFYALTDNIAELVPFLCFVLLRIPLPLGTIAMLLIDLGTDIVPTIALAYESSENDIMKLMPRNPKTDHLITNKLISYSYGQIGVIEACGGLFTYFVILAENGFWPLILINVRNRWDSHAVSDLTDYYGQEWSYSARKKLEYTCWSGFFVSIVVVQWANLIICKTRRVSVLQKGMNNWVLNFALIFETVLAAFLCYCPGMDIAFKMYPLKVQWWFTALPFVVLILVYDECRRYIIRNYKNGWFYSEFYY